jgi:hypothetical protein
VILEERAAPLRVVRIAPHREIGSFIRSDISDISFGAGSVLKDLVLRIWAFTPLVSEARITGPAGRTILQTPTSDKPPPGPIGTRCVTHLTLCARRSRATTACGAAVPAGGSNASPARTRLR